MDTVSEFSMVYKVSPSSVPVGAVPDKFVGQSILFGVSLPTTESEAETYRVRIPDIIRHKKSGMPGWRSA